MAKEYDLLLCGVTGFTGKLAAEHLLAKAYPIKWAVCARNEAKAKSCLAVLGEQLGKTQLPPVEVADLVCTTAEEEAKLRAVVKKTKVVITTAGPFEKYGQTLVKLCAEEGVDYADISGESDFLRAMVAQHDATAQQTGARIVVHCGNDCIPWDLTVFEMHKHAQSKGAELIEAQTFGEFGDSFGASGGTLTTAIYQLGKQRSAAKPDFDPLLRTRDGRKSDSLTKITNPKNDVWVGEFGQYGGPWIMGPVMANCVRRSNALLGYSPNLVFRDALLRGHPTVAQWVGEKAYTTLVAAAVVMPSLFQRFLPGPGEGPSREAMESNYLNLHAIGKMVDAASGQQTSLKAKYHFPGDTGYLYTAKMLVEAGMQLLEDKGQGGVLSPAAAFGSSGKLVLRLDKELGAKLEIGEA